MKTTSSGSKINARMALILLPVFLLTLNSCVGISLDIKMNKDGSGTLTFEYRISRALDSFGNLDGNAMKPSIPVGREDWEKTIQRIKGVSITSFSEKQSGQDTIYTVNIAFNNPQALIAILDPAGKKSKITLDNNSGKFSMILLDKNLTGEYDRNLIDLAHVLFNDYYFSIKFSAHGNSKLSITNGEGVETALPVNAQVIPSGKHVSMSIGIMDLLELPDGIGVKLNW